MKRALLAPALALAVAAFASAGLTAGASAQGLGFGGGDDNVPLEVYADNGIEWHQNESTYVAHGNARAIKGNVTVYGDTLTAHYRKATTGSSEVWKVEANGNVRIVSPDDTAYGDNAVYTIDDGGLIMTGKALRLVTPRETITARDRLEYWEQKNLAVARGDALTVTDDGRRIRADTLTALFKPADDKQGGGKQAAAPAKPPAKPTRVASNGAAPAKDRAGGDSRLQRMDAVGNVVITTPEEVARGERGVYFEDSGIATLTGSVKITRGQNQLNGEAAEVNLRTGISKLVTQPGGAKAPVRALLVPEKRDDGTPAGPAGLSKPR
ncbi:MAG TPA: LptA/OstA family protein [Alphaproteobacteria bacterium]|jgi:lipopolysaccharide export system protein LptA